MSQKLLVAMLGSTYLRRKAGGGRVWPICGQIENKFPRPVPRGFKTTAQRSSWAPFISQGLAALLSSCPSVP